jgi:hypothetical protein
MRSALLIGVMAMAAALLIANASAEPPVPILVRIAATHTRPHAGHAFTGITVTNLGTQIATVRCNVHLGGKFLSARDQRFYSSSTRWPDAVSCTWQIPVGAKRRIVRATVQVETLTNGLYDSPVYSWRIKP